MCLDVRSWEVREKSWSSASENSSDTMCLYCPDAANLCNSKLLCRIMFLNRDAIHTPIVIAIIRGHLYGGGVEQVPSVSVSRYVVRTGPKAWEGAHKNYAKMFIALLYLLIAFLWVRFLPRDATRSAVMPHYVGCPSVTLRYRDHIGWNTSKNNFTADYLKVYAQADPNMGDLVQREYPQS